MRKLLTIILLVCCALPSFSQNCIGEVDKQLPFGVGEKFKYAVNYSAAIINTSVADVTFEVSLVKHNNVPCYKIFAVGRTRPFFNIFFELEDKYTSLLDTVNLKPVKAYSDLKEGGYLFKTEYTYNWKNKTVSNFTHNIKRDDRNHKMLQLTNCSYDALSLFYNMRRINPDKLVPKQKLKLDFVSDDTVRTIQVVYHGREIKRIENLGKFRTLKFSCQFATATDDTFKDGTEFFIWISDDKNRIPIYLESPIRVGKVFAYLTSWEGLLNSFSSIIPK